MRNFFHRNIPATGEVGELDSEEAFHALKVIRLRVGDEIGLMDGVGTCAVAEVKNAVPGGKKRKLSFVIKRRSTFSLPDVRISLFIAMPKGKLSGDVVRSAVELGVSKLIPVVCEHSIVKPGKKSKTENWKSEAVAAIKQSGNAFLPEFSCVLPFDEALQLSSQRGVFGDARTGKQKFSNNNPAEFSVWIGPEGGFSDEEKNAMCEHGLKPLRIGQWILRVETAVPAVLGNVLCQLPETGLQCGKISSEPV